MSAAILRAGAAAFLGAVLGAVLALGAVAAGQQRYAALAPLVGNARPQPPRCERTARMGVLVRALGQPAVIPIVAEVCVGEDGRPEGWAR